MTQHSFKVELEGKDYTFPLPSSFPKLLEQIEEVFSSDLPPHWSLQYKDEEGDLVMLITPEGFESLVEEYDKNRNDITIHIIPREEQCMVLSRSKPSKEIIQLSDSSRESYNLMEENAEEKKEAISQVLDEIVDIQSKSVEVSCSEKADSVERSSQTESQKAQIECMNQVDLVESSSQTLQLDRNESMKDQISQTHNNSLMSQDKGLQYDPEMMNLSGISKAKAENVLSADKNFGYELVEREEIDKSDSVSHSSVHNAEDKGEQQRNEELNAQEKENDDHSILEDDNNPIPRVEKGGEKQAVHPSCKCDGCGASPIIGARYRCSVCDDLDFCEKCEAEKDHAHLFLKLRTVDDYHKFESKNLWPYSFFLDEDSLLNRFIKYVSNSKIVQAVRAEAHVEFVEVDG